MVEHTPRCGGCCVALVRAVAAAAVAGAAAPNRLALGVDQAERVAAGTEGVERSACCAVHGHGHGRRHAPFPSGFTTPAPYPPASPALDNTLPAMFNVPSALALAPSSPACPSSLLQSLALVRQQVERPRRRAAELWLEAAGAQLATEVGGPIHSGACRRGCHQGWAASGAGGPLAAKTRPPQALASSPTSPAIRHPPASVDPPPHSPPATLPAHPSAHRLPA